MKKRLFLFVAMSNMVTAFAFSMRQDAAMAIFFQLFGFWFMYQAEKE